MQDTIGGYRVTIVRICPIGGFRDARANTTHIETGPIRNTPYGDRNRRGGSMVALCQATGAPAPRPGFPEPDNLPILSILAGRPRVHVVSAERPGRRRGEALASGAGLP